MPDTAVAEVETAEPAEEAPPTPEPKADEPKVPEGGDVPAEGSDKGIPEGLDPEKTEAWLEAEAERRAAEKAAKLEADAEKRVKQRVKEADDGESARVQLYATAESEARRSAQLLSKMARDGDVLTPETLEQHLNPILAGVHAITARDNEAVVKALTDALLPDQTDEETKELEPLLYDFRRNGRFNQLPAKVAELALARKDAEIADLRKKLGDRESVKKAVEDLKKLADGAGPGVGAEVPKGRAAGTKSTWDEIQKMDKAQLDALPEGEFERAMNEA